MPNPLATRLRIFNKHFTNPLLGRIARSPYGPFAIVQHVGRRSGKTYENPIIVFRTATGFIVALTYGTEVDWYRNVMAAGRCVIIWHQREYPIERLEPLMLRDIEPLLRQPYRAILGIVNTTHFVRMTAADS